LNNASRINAIISRAKTNIECLLRANTSSGFQSALPKLHPT